MKIVDKIRTYSLEKRDKKIQSSVPFEEALWIEKLCQETGETEAAVIACIIKSAYLEDRKMDPKNDIE